MDKNEKYEVFDTLKSNDTNLQVSPQGRSLRKTLIGEKRTLTQIGEMFSEALKWRDNMNSFNDVKKINFEDTQRISDEQLDKLFKMDEIEARIQTHSD